MASAGDKSPTNKLYAKLANLLAAVSLWIGLDTGSMAAYDATTNAATTECADTGLARASATVSQVTTTVTNDTCRVTKTFTKGSSSPATSTINGHIVMSASSSGDMYSWCYYSNPAVLSDTDQLICTSDHQMEIGS